MKHRIVLCVFAAVAGCGGERTISHTDILVFSRTNGYRHADAIDAALARLPDRLAAEGLTMIATEDPAFADELERYRAVFFLYTTGNDVLTPSGKLALEDFVRRGGGFVGIHSATDTEYAWPFYQELVAAPFQSHPAIQPATVDIVDRMHPSTSSLPTGRWSATDEWYNFARDPGDVEGVRVLATLDETTYTGGTMGADHPIAWAHERLGGRMFYTGLGHVAARWDEPAFVDHVIGGVRWALGAADR